MRFKNLLFVVLGLSSLSFGVLSQAADLSVEQDVLFRLQQLSENQQLLLRDKEQSLLEFERKLLSAQTDLTEAQNELERKEQELLTATAGGESQARQRKLAEHAASMAKRSVKNRLKRAQRIEGKLAQEKAALEKARNQMLQSRNRIAQQEAKLAELKARNNAEKRRLAQINAQRAASAPIKVSNPLPVAKTPAIVKSDSKAQGKGDATPKTVQTLAKANSTDTRQAALTRKPLTGGALAGEPKPDVASPQSTEEKDNAAAQAQLAQLDELARKQAAAEERRLAEALAGPKRSGRQRYSDLRIQSATVDASFEFLGNHQYRAQTPITGGRHMFTVGSHHYRGTIPITDDGEIYVFLFDTSRKGKPRLSMYRKSLLN